MNLNLILILLLNFMFVNEDSELIKIRKLYEQAAVKEKAQSDLSNLLENIKVETSLISGYKGANMMIGAHYSYSPFGKLNQFNKGKKLIQFAIENEPKSLELRYLRFTIQTNIPRFLGYSSYINRDKEFMISHLALMTDIDLRDRVVAYLLLSKRCTENELKKVEVWKNK